MKFHSYAIRPRDARLGGYEVTRSPGRSTQSDPVVTVPTKKLATEVAQALAQAQSDLADLNGIRADPESKPR